MFDFLFGVVSVCLFLLSGCFFFVARAYAFRSAFRFVSMIRSVFCLFIFFVCIIFSCCSVNFCV